MTRLARASRWMERGRAVSGVPRSFVQPEILEARVVVDRVVVNHEALHVRVPAGGHVLVGDDRPGEVLGQLPLDLPDDLLALVEVDLLRLLVDECIDVLVAVLGQVAL